MGSISENDTVAPVERSLAMTVGWNAFRDVSDGSRKREMREAMRDLTLGDGR